MKLGLIGAGRIGKLHGEVITYHVDDATIEMVSDVYTEGLKDWAEPLGIQNITNDYKEILENPDIEGVLICSSTDTHADLIIESAKAGKHIFCEKPVDFNVEKIQFALDTVKDAGVKLQIGFNRRFDHNFNKVQREVKQGKIGDVHIVKITSRDPAPPPVEYIKVSGGLFLDMMIHDFDMARFLSGSEVEEVFTYGTVLVDEKIGEAGDVDTAIVNLRFKNGAIGVIDNSRQAVYGYDQRVEVFGSKGMVLAENDFPTTVKVLTDDAVTEDKPKYFFLERYKESYASELIAFVKAVKDDQEPLVIGNDGLAPVLIGLAAKRSLDEKRPVMIEEILG
ncbi:inositol 2-dehydrogenase [Vallitalea okinawensis]|uniref:inositol 2-dehydrogenase n=1 Tax=Vallitalea okinawensis TaxID=2078660 RepID=UPI000CFD0143|nr:inositol 2-dehydrogenase [Vallitalea okinawensis]